MKNTYSLINDSQSLKGARYGLNHDIDIPVYDDGYGKLYVHRNSLGISGIVRARNWQDAYSICEDEFFPDADMTHEEMLKEYGFTREHVKMIHPLDAQGNVDKSVIRPATPADYEANGRILSEQFVRWDVVETPCDDYTENDIWQECFGFRPNGGGTGEYNKSHIYAKDLNGDRLDLLTPELLKDLDITLDIVDCE